MAAIEGGVIDIPFLGFRVTVYRKTLNIWIVEPPIWHPNVDFMTGMTTGSELEESLQCAYVNNPINIVAGAEYELYYEAFLEKSKRIFNKI